ncbi:hypothetical protein RU94_GL001766 [Enterococcus asini]|nr:hypothetical protein RU94_GL001766 [Enterococcus asini]
MLCFSEKNLGHHVQGFFATFKESLKLVENHWVRGNFAEFCRILMV